MSDVKRYVTKKGRVLTDSDIEALADEAERGYPVEKLKDARPRRQEKGLEVVWQRHLPLGLGGSRTADARVDAVADLATHVEEALEQYGYDVLDTHDLVVTISRRPLG